MQYDQANNLKIRLESIQNTLTKNIRLIIGNRSGGLFGDKKSAIRCAAEPKDGSDPKKAGQQTVKIYQTVLEYATVVAKLSVLKGYKSSARPNTSVGSAGIIESRNKDSKDNKNLLASINKLSNEIERILANTQKGAGIHSKDAGNSALVVMGPQKSTKAAIEFVKDQATKNFKPELKKASPNLNDKISVLEKPKQSKKFGDELQKKDLVQTGTAVPKTADLNNDDESKENDELAPGNSPNLSKETDKVLKQEDKPKASPNLNDKISVLEKPKQSKKFGDKLQKKDFVKTETAVPKTADLNNDDESKENDEPAPGNSPNLSKETDKVLKQEDKPKQVVRKTQADDESTKSNLSNHELNIINTVGDIIDGIDSYSKEENQHNTDNKPSAAVQNTNESLAKPSGVGDHLNKDDEEQDHNYMEMEMEMESESGQTILKNVLKVVSILTKEMEVEQKVDNDDNKVAQKANTAANEAAKTQACLDTFAKIFVRMYRVKGLKIWGNEKDFNAENLELGSNSSADWQEKVEIRGIEKEGLKEIEKSFAKLVDKFDLEKLKKSITLRIRKVTKNLDSSDYNFSFTDLEKYDRQVDRYLKYFDQSELDHQIEKARKAKKDGTEVEIEIEIDEAHTILSVDTLKSIERDLIWISLLTEKEENYDKISDLVAKILVRIEKASEFIGVLDIESESFGLNHLEKSNIGVLPVKIEDSEDVENLVENIKTILENIYGIKGIKTILLDNASKQLKKAAIHPLKYYNEIDKELKNSYVRDYQFSVLNNIYTALEKIDGSLEGEASIGTELLNKYVDICIRVSMVQGIIINKVEGDGIMNFSPEPIPVNEEFKTLVSSIDQQLDRIKEKIIDDFDQEDEFYARLQQRMEDSVNTKNFQNIGSYYLWVDEEIEKDLGLKKRSKDEKRNIKALRNADKVKEDLEKKNKERIISSTNLLKRKIMALADKASTEEGLDEDDIGEYLVIKAFLICRNVAPENLKSLFDSNLTNEDFSKICSDIETKIPASVDLKQRVDSLKTEEDTLEFVKSFLEQEFSSLSNDLLEELGSGLSGLEQYIWDNNKADGLTEPRECDLKDFSDADELKHFMLLARLVSDGYGKGDKKYKPLFAGTSKKISDNIKLIGESVSGINQYLTQAAKNEINSYVDDTLNDMTTWADVKYAFDHVHYKERAPRHRIRTGIAVLGLGGALAAGGLSLFLGTDFSLVNIVAGAFGYTDPFSTQITAAGAFGPAVIPLVNFLSVGLLMFVVIKAAIAINKCSFDSEKAIWKFRHNMGFKALQKHLNEHKNKNLKVEITRTNEGAKETFRTRSAEDFKLRVNKMYGDKGDEAKEEIIKQFDQDIADGKIEVKGIEYK